MHRFILAALMASQFVLSTAHASADAFCAITPTLMQSDGACGMVPFLSPGNDSRINALLLMADSHKLAQVLPSQDVVASVDRASRLVVPFQFDFSGWIDIEQASSEITTGETTDDASSARYADGEGNICRSLSPGSQGFHDALDSAAAISADEVTILRRARRKIGSACATDGGDRGGAGLRGLSPSLASSLRCISTVHMLSTHAISRPRLLHLREPLAVPIPG
ncbi:hypothetical protein PIN31115_04477 [Pandoraea iniqua]|uniref:Lipoprotein n=1 Tax=Pandoraea iniqua TaxID=2508288 RepID=A0A5E4YH07_9BURK|nr:hypothetical protein PIN31115_04477 [Pandoraea iniqua]